MPSNEIGANTKSTATDSTAHAHAHAHRTAAQDYSRNPMLVYWEMTQACALACRHCRAEAVSTPHPEELTHAESMELLRQIAVFDKPLPHLVLTGGDPLRRADLYPLIDEAHRLGLTVSITPSATGDLTYDVLAKLKAHGIESLGLSLDGSTAALHEAVRGVEGCFDWTIRAAQDAAKLGIPIQVNTLVSQETEDDLPAIYELLKSVSVMRWSLFFLIAVGRGKLLQPVSAERGEELMRWACDLAQAAPFVVATTEAPSYRRIALERMRAAGWTREQIAQTPVYRGFEIRDGHGIVFISASCTRPATSRASAASASTARSAAVRGHAHLRIPATRWRAIPSARTSRRPAPRADPTHRDKAEMNGAPGKGQYGDSGCARMTTRRGDDDAKGDDDAWGCPG
jgi:MoaA/NifB/PqqE/SkfB family radical SAM enzyme